MFPMVRRAFCAPSVPTLPPPSPSPAAAFRCQPPLCSTMPPSPGRCQLPQPTQTRHKPTTSVVGSPRYAAAINYGGYYDDDGVAQKEDGRCCCCYGKEDEEESGEGGRCAGLCWKCVAKCSKALLIVPNVLFMLVGVVLIATGLWLYVDRRTLLSQSFVNELLVAGGRHQVPVVVGVAASAAFDEHYAVSWAVVVGIGCAALLLSFVGCCGACTDSAGSLCFYSVLLIILVVAEVIACIVMGIMQRQIHEAVERVTRERVLYSYRETDDYRFSSIPLNDTEALNELFSAVWDRTQNDLSCCGSSGPDDFRYSAWRNTTARKDTTELPPIAVPLSCCEIIEHRMLPDVAAATTTMTTKAWPLADDCQRAAITRWQHLDDEQTTHSRRRDVIFNSTTGSSRLKTEGCAQSMFNLVNRNARILLGVVCGIVLLQVADAGLACVLAYWIRRQQATNRRKDRLNDEIDYY